MIYCTLSWYGIFYSILFYYSQFYFIITYYSPGVVVYIGSVPHEKNISLLPKPDPSRSALFRRLVFGWDRSLLAAQARFELRVARPVVGTRARRYEGARWTSSLRVERVGLYAEWYKNIYIYIYIFVYMYTYIYIYTLYVMLYYT